MSRRFTPKVVCANALIEGDAVWMTADGGWTGVMHEAVLLTDAESADAMLAKANAQADRIVGAYLADAEEGPDGPRPAHFRETFRTRGPSNYFHGKQAERAARQTA